MSARSTRPRPAVPVALALLSGIALERALTPEIASAASSASAGLAAVAWLGRGRAWGRLACLLALACAGAHLAQRGGAAAERRIARWLPADGTPIEMHFEGTLAGAPEPCGAERRFRVTGRPEAKPHGGRSCTILLSVPEPGPGASLDRLRRGDRIRVWCRLRRPRSPGNPGEADPRLALLARGVDAVGSVKSARLVQLVSPGAATPARVLDELKVVARSRLRGALGDRGAATAVVGAMLLGDQGMLGHDEWLLLRDSGLVHLLSISGLHVGLGVALLLAVLRRTRLPRWGILLAASATLSVLALFVGAQPPVLRSVLTALLALAGRALGRESEPLNALALAAAVLACLRPAYLWDPSFELTFAATAGILAFAPRMARRIPAPKVLALPLAVSAAAYLGTVPVTAWQFGRLAPVALLSNIAAAALCGAVLTSGTAALLLAGIPVAGDAAARLAAASVNATLTVASAASSVPAAAFRVPPPSPPWLAAYAILLALLVQARRLGGEGALFRRCAGLGVSLALVAIHLGPLPRGTAPPLDATVIDVGQGQSVLLEGPSGGSVLVDAGGTAGGRFDAGERIVAPALSRRGCRRIDALVVSHGHDDHAGGAEAVLREFEVGELWIPCGTLGEERVRRLAETAVARGVAVVLAGKGLSTVRAGLPIEVLHPRCERRGEAPNERSLVLRAGPQGARILIPADLESPEEEELLTSGADVSADALVVAHHGGGRGTSDAHLSSVRPRLAVISVGVGNRFGHPDPAVLARLRARRIPVYRTDLDGQVRVRASTSGLRAEFTRKGGEG